MTRLPGAVTTVLVAAQTLFGAQMPMLIIFGGLAGAYLADNKALATLPVSVMMLMTMLMAGPISLFMGKCRRRAGFLVGVSAGAVGGLLGGVCPVSASIRSIAGGMGVFRDLSVLSWLLPFCGGGYPSDAFRP
ncbi:MAG: hypothetical protein R3E89_11685 [Thiolinea sp.]